MTNSEAKCREIRQAVSEQPAGAVVSQDLQRHIRDCSDCRRLAEAAGSPGLIPPPSADLMTRLAESMRSDLRPVRPLASPATFAIILAGILFGALGIATYSMYPYGWEEMGALKTTAVLAGLASAGVVCAWSLLKQMTPAARYRVRPQVLPLLIVGGLATGTAILFGFEREDDFWASSWICLKIGLSIAVPTAALVWLVLRKGVFLSPALSGATAGVLAGLVGVGALEVHCPNLNAWHILVSHLGVAVVLCVSGLAVGLAINPPRSRTWAGF